MLSEGQMSDDTGAKLLYPHLPVAAMLIADKGYDSDEFRNALAAKGITPCIPQGLAITYDKELYRTRGRIEIMFGRLKDWRRIARPRCPHILLGDLHRRFGQLLALIKESCKLKPYFLEKLDRDRTFQTSFRTWLSS
jgi:transposase